MIKFAQFHPAAITVIRDFPEQVRREVGKVVFDIQKGESLSMPLSRPMSSVKTGAHELRLKDSSGIYRVFYYTKVKEKILIFHAFTKKTQQTPQHEIKMAQKRLQEMLDYEKD